MSSAAVGQLCNIYLFGSLAVTDANDLGRTPRSQKSRALIAMLALSPRGSRSRVWLRDKLWSDRAEEQASASLRQALVEIRKALGPVADQLIHADKHTISLDLARVRVDALELLESVESANGGGNASLPIVSQSEFLEGLDVCDPEFEEWLTLERQVWRDRLDKASALRDFTPKQERGNDLPRSPSNDGGAGAGSRNGNGNGKSLARKAGLPGWSVAVLPPKILGEPSSAGYLCDFFSDVLTKSLLETGDISVSDYSRHDSDFLTGLLERSVFETPALALQVRHSFSGRQINTTVSLHRTTDHALLWIGSATLDRAAVEAQDTSTAHLLVNEATAEINRHFARQDNAPSQGEPADESLFSAINAMFRLSRTDLAMSEETLRRHIESRPSSQAYAWLAFLMTFRIGQRFVDSASTYEQAQHYARKALELDNNHAVTLALVGHVHSFLFGEYDFASGLFERSIRANPTQPLSWDLYSMLHAYAGQPDKGLSLAKWGRHLGTFSPIRYYFDTSKCINAALSGQHQIAIEAGEQALRERPDFNSLLRYLTASKAHLGDMAAARRLLDRLEAVEPDFSIGSLVATRYPILQTEGGAGLIAGLIKAGAKK
jgi:tetratricopeptide (TPR) repeat protein